MSAHDELDRLVGLAREHDWAVVDDRRTRCVLWFTRGRHYVHAGVNRAGDLLHVYGGERRRPNRFWTASRDADGTQPNHHEALEQVLVQQYNPYE